MFFRAEEAGPGQVASMLPRRGRGRGMVADLVPPKARVCPQMRRGLA
jgi:hypothetical protein